MGYSAKYNAPTAAQDVEEKHRRTTQGMRPRWVASSRADFPGWSGFVRPKGRFASYCLLEILTTIPRLQRPTKLVVKRYVSEIRKRHKNLPVAFPDPPDLEAASIQGCVTRSLTSCFTCSLSTTTGWPLEDQTRHSLQSNLHRLRGGIYYIR